MAVAAGGVVQRIYLDNIRPEYSRVYHIKEASAPQKPKDMTSSQVPITSTLKPSMSSSHLAKPSDKTSFQYKDTNELRDSNRQTAKDRILSEHQLLMASSSASAASVNFTCLLSLLTSFLLLANIKADVVIR